MIFLGQVVGSPEQSFQKVSFKPVCLDWYNLKVAAEIEAFARAYYSAVASLLQLTGLESEVSST